MAVTTQFLRSEHAQADHVPQQAITSGRSAAEVINGRTRPPSMQALAFYAHDHFGEDGFPYEGSVPSSFDMVVDVYAREADSTGNEATHAHACTAVITRLQSQGRASVGARLSVDGFVEKTMAYLRSQYPGASRVVEERQMLSNLFWGYLVASRRTD